MKLAAILPSGDPAKYNLESVKSIIAGVVQLAMTLAGIIAVIYIIIGAYNYFTAYGNEAKATAAKTTITWAVIGVVVIILAKVIITLIWNFIASGSTPGFWF
mgnify:CR=1 FL=1